MIELNIVLASIKSAIDIAQGINKLSQDVAVKEKAIQLMNVIIDLQKNLSDMHGSYDELTNEKNKIEARLREFENWAKTEELYELKEIQKGIFVYVFNKQPEHWLCPNCVGEKKKSILQQVNTGITQCFCPRCKFAFIVGVPPKSGPRTIGRG